MRRQVCKRIARRIKELGLADLAAYRERLECAPEEWPELDALCRITISRFYRDRAVFDHLGDAVLPALAAAAGQRRPSRGSAQRSRATHSASFIGRVARMTAS